jgi:putative heme-binding domain-containing protein
VNPYDEMAPLEARARSWLHANCSACHREHGGGSVPLLANVEVPNNGMLAIDVKPTRGDFGMPDAQVIAPGRPGSSILLHRIAKSGAGHMPLIGAHEADVRGVKLVADWVRSLAPDQPQPANTGDPHDTLNFLLKLDRGEADRSAALAAAISSPNPHIRDLLERFLPDRQRVETLGSSASVSKIDPIPGDAARGAALVTLSGKGAVCMSCHFFNGAGRDYGPDLSKVGGRLKKSDILESILTPSKVIAQGFQAYVITLKDGSIHTGFIVKRENEAVKLKIATGQTEVLNKAQIQTEQALPTSLMPEGLFSGFTAQEAADLVAYLSSLK